MKFLYKEYWFDKTNFIKKELSILHLGINLIGYFPYHTARIRGIYDNKEQLSSLICLPRTLFKHLESSLSIYNVMDNKAVYIFESIYIHNQYHNDNFAIMFKDDFCLIGHGEQVTNWDGTPLIIKNTKNE